MSELARRYRARRHVRPMRRLSADELQRFLILDAGLPETARIHAEINQDYAKAHGIENAVSWDGREVWVRVDSPEEARELKPRLRDMGYGQLQTFQGSMDAISGRHWILKGVQGPLALSDSQGRSTDLLRDLLGIGLVPQFVYVDSVRMYADFELTHENLDGISDLLQILEAGGDPVPALSRNELRAVDVVRVDFWTPEGPESVSIDELRQQMPAVTPVTVPEYEHQPRRSLG